MIDCKITIDKKPDPKGDRVLLTFECVDSILGSVPLTVVYIDTQW